MSGYILLVDDDDEVRDGVGHFLAAKGFRVCVAADGGAALAVLKQRGLPCFMIIDWQMPKVGGAELLRILRCDPSTARIPAVVFTAAPRLVTSPVLVVPKPSLDELLEVVRSHCTAGREGMFCTGPSPLPG